MRRGILACSGELFVQTSHDGAQPLQFSELLIQLLLQPSASGTGVRCCFCHALILGLICLIGQNANAVNAHDGSSQVAQTLVLDFHDRTHSPSRTNFCNV